MKTIIGIIGTTSVGKSAVAVRLAQLLNTEIISADSMQIYKGMDIGTAKITAEQMCGVKHRMLDIIEPNVNFSAFLYQEQASKIIDRMPSVPIVVGGTGMYFDSLLFPPEFKEISAERKVELRAMLEQNGLEYMQQMLKLLDSESYDTVDLCNPKRVLRAIEIAESGGKRSSGQNKSATPRYDCRLFVLQRNRESLYRQINERVDAMIEQGLIEEVSNLVAKYGVCDTTAFCAIGYKEIIEYLQGKVTLSEAVDKIKINTRHYAKRQITYYKKMNVSKYIDVDDRSIDEVSLEILENLQNSQNYSRF